MKTEDIYYIHQNRETRDVIRLFICGTTNPDKSYHIIRPNSRTCCIEYVEEGKGTVHINDETFFPCTGDSYFLQSGKDQDYYSNVKEPWKKHFINLRGPLVDSLVSGYGLNDISFFKGLSLEKELKKIIEIVKLKKGDYTNQIILIVQEMFLKMYMYKKNLESTQNLGTAMKDFLDTQCTEKFNIDSLCKHISRSKSQTIRLFRECFGITPYQYVLSKKISLAKKLLENTNLSIKEISVQLCFSSEYSFSNAFKKKVGGSPYHYRKWSRQEYNG